MYTLFCLFLTLHLTFSTPQITIYGNVFTNQNFFTKSLPWIVDNVGGDLTMEFYMMGSGRHTIPQMCALEQLRCNNFLKAQYLKCEAEAKFNAASKAECKRSGYKLHNAFPPNDVNLQSTTYHQVFFSLHCWSWRDLFTAGAVKGFGHPSRYCLCEAGIDAQPFKECVRNGGNYVSEASEQYSRLKINALPLVEVGYKNTVFEVTDEWYLKKICTLFLDVPPLGCVQPFACNVTEVWDSRPGIAHIDKECVQSDRPVPPVDTTPSSTPSTTLLPLLPSSTTMFVSN